jgi:hypothetical protein
LFAIHPADCRSAASAATAAPVSSPFMKMSEVHFQVIAVHD